MANGPIQIDTDAVTARIGELTALLDDTAMRDALAKLNAETFNTSVGVNRDNCIAIATHSTATAGALDALIQHSITLMSDTQNNFVAVDERLANELAG